LKTEKKKIFFSDSLALIEFCITFVHAFNEEHYTIS